MHELYIIFYLNLIGLSQKELCEGKHKFSSGVKIWCQNCIFSKVQYYPKTTRDAGAGDAVNTLKPITG